MALTKITSRILDSSGVTILGTIATGVWQGSVIAEAYLQNQSGTNTGDQTNISGNAGTATLADEATILANTRNINGVAFNGSTNITIADATKLPLAGGTLTGQLTGTTANLIGTIKSTLASDNSYYSLFSNNGSLVLDTAGVNSGMQFKILGSTKLTMSNSGNVGIGTTSPSSYDAEGDNLVVYDAVTPGITIALPQTTAAGSARGSVLFSDGTSGSEKYRGGVIYDHGTGMGGIADTMYIRAAINSYLVLGPTGNIGIGTKTPDGSDWNSNSRLLHIYQNTTNGSLLKLESSNTSLVVASGNSQAQIGTVEAKPLKFYTNTTERMSIGTSTNTLVLKSAGTTGGNYLQFQNSSSTVQGYVGYGSSGSNTLYLAQQAANSDIVMYNGGQSRLTIESGGAATFGGTVTSTSGFLGNATTSSRFKSTAQSSATATNANLLYTGIHMNYYSSGTVSNAASGGYGTVISFGGSGGGVAGSLQMQAVLNHNSSSNATNSLYFRIGNNLGYSNDWKAFTYTAVSDYRLKENIKPMNSVIDRIKSMNAVSFNFINEPDKEVEGFIAHEVQEIIPEAVLNEKDKVGSNGTPMYQSIDYSKITPFLIKAIQEQQAQIELLKQEVELLKQ